MSDWSNSTLKELFTIKQGTYLEPEVMQTGPCLVYGANGVIGRTIKPMYESPVSLVSCRGANCGVVHFTSPNCWVSNNSMALDLKDTKNNDSKFFYYLLSNNSFADEISGSAQPQIVASVLGNKKILFPISLKTQSKIAEILTTVDQLIELSEIEISRLEDLKKGLLRSIFGRDAKKGWLSKRFDEIALLTNGRGFKPHEWSTKGLPIIRIQNLNGNPEFNYFEGEYDPKIMINYGDLLFAWSGSRGTSFGPHIWHGQTGVLNYHTWLVSPHTDVVDKNFLFYLLKYITEEIENQAHGAAALVHMQKWAMEEYPVSIPLLSEQRQILTSLQSLDELLKKKANCVGKRKMIKKALMNDLLTGKVRVKV